VEVNIEITTARFTANTLILHVFQSMVNGIDECRPIRIGIIRPTRFVNNHIFYAEYGRGILDLMGRRGLDCTGSG
jgi:hypothetical protein